MDTKMQASKYADLKPRIVVIGVGGGGGNAVNNMLATGLTGAKFIVANTDAQALSVSGAEHRIQLGARLTEGIGAGAKPEIGEAAAEEALEEIRAALAGAHMVFIAAGMGGGTGTGAASVIARVAKEFGILTVAVVTKPFTFEGKRRMRVAEAGIAELKRHVDTLLVIPNQNLFKIANDRTAFAEAFRAGRPGALLGRRLHRRPGRQGRAHQSRSGRREDGPERHGNGHDGHRRGVRRAARRSMPRGQRSSIRCWTTSRSAGPRACCCPSAAAATSRCLRCTTPSTACARNSTPTPTSSSAPRWTRASQGASACRSSPRAWRAPSRTRSRPRAAANAHLPSIRSGGQDFRNRLSEAIGGYGQPDAAPAQNRRCGAKPGRPQAMSSSETGTAYPADQHPHGGNGRSMPAVEDFPPVAQREYWAKASDVARPAGHAQRRVRATGGCRRAGQVCCSGLRAWAATNGPSQIATKEVPRTPQTEPMLDGREEQVDLPVFFGAGKRCRDGETVAQLRRNGNTV